MQRRTSSRKPFQWRFAAMSAALHLGALIPLTGFFLARDLDLKKATRVSTQAIAFTLLPRQSIAAGHGLADVAVGSSLLRSDAEDRGENADFRERRPSFKKSRASKQSRAIKDQAIARLKQIKPRRHKQDQKVSLIRATAPRLHQDPVLLPAAVQAWSQKQQQMQDAVLKRADDASLSSNYAAGQNTSTVKRPERPLFMQPFAQRQRALNARDRRKQSVATSLQRRGQVIVSVPVSGANIRVSVDVSIEQEFARFGAGGDLGEGAKRDVEGRGGQRERSEDNAHEIAQKVAQVLPLVYWDWERRGALDGETVVRFRLNAEGYVEHLIVVYNDGETQLLGDSSDALQLASPYRYVPGWIRLRLRFFA